MPPLPWSRFLVFELSNGSDLDAAAREAISAAESIHGVRSSIRLPVEADDTIPSRGRYVIADATDWPERIKLNPHSAYPALSALHELGHFLDHWLVGARGEWASPALAELEDWRTAVEQSEALDELRNLAANPQLPELQAFYTYMTTYEEAFARSYSEWVTVRTDSDTLWEEFGRTQGLNYPELWTNDDFGPVGDSVDAFFRTLGWMA